MQLQVFTEVQWAGGRCSPRLANDMLTRQARLEHRSPSEAGRGSVVGDGMEIGFPGLESRE